MIYLLSALGILLLLGIFIYRQFQVPVPVKVPPLEKEAKAYLRDYIVYYRNLSLPDQHRFEERVQRFLREVKITGIETEVDLYDQILVAASGIIPTFGFEHWNHYPRLKEVLLYKNAFRQGDFATEGGDRRIAGMVGGGYLSGKLLLSRTSLHQGFEHPGRDNTGIHEFVHLLDMADGETNGIPAYFLDNTYLIPWMEMMRSEMEAIERQESDIDVYATTNRAEFLAVTAEYFFNRPAAFAENHPKLFGLMERIFQQDLNDDGVVGA